MASHTITADATVHVVHRVVMQASLPECPEAADAANGEEAGEDDDEAAVAGAGGGLLAEHKEGPSGTTATKLAYDGFKDGKPQVRRQRGL